MYDKFLEVFNLTSSFFHSWPGWITQMEVTIHPWKGHE